MRFILVRVICAAALYLGSISMVAAQPYRTLNAEDFQGTPASRTLAIAYTHCNVDVNYRATAENGYYRLYFDVKLLVDKNKSWLNRGRITSPAMLGEILNHEQGHYSIAYMEQHEVQREMERTRFGADYESKVKEIFDRIDAKYKQLNNDYDEDTQHMVNRAQQHSWDAYFNKRLHYMPPS
jgi:hypothetical protein